MQRGWKEVLVSEALIPHEFCFTQKPLSGSLLRPERGEGEVSAHVRRAAELVLGGGEHLPI